MIFSRPSELLRRSKLIKAIVWTGAFLLSIYGIIHAFWLTLLYLLYQDGRMWIAAAAELILLGIYFWLIKIL